jgi:hypothetical protein
VIKKVAVIMCRNKACGMVYRIHLKAYTSKMQYHKKGEYLDKLNSCAGVLHFMKNS